MVCSACWKFPAVQLNCVATANWGADLREDPPVTALFDTSTHSRTQTKTRGLRSHRYVMIRDNSANSQGVASHELHESRSAALTGQWLRLCSQEPGAGGDPGADSRTDGPTDVEGIRAPEVPVRIHITQWRFSSFAPPSSHFLLTNQQGIQPTFHAPRTQQLSLTANSLTCAGTALHRHCARQRIRLGFTSSTGGAPLNLPAGSCCPHISKRERGIEKERDSDC